MRYRYNPVSSEPVPVLVDKTTGGFYRSQACKDLDALLQDQARGSGSRSSAAAAGPPPKAVPPAGWHPTLRDPSDPPPRRVVLAGEAVAPSAALVTAAAPGAPPSVPRLPWSQRSPQPPPAVAKPPSKPVPVKEAPAKLAANFTIAESSTLLEALRSEATPVDIHQHVEIDYTPNEPWEILRRLRVSTTASGVWQPASSSIVAAHTENG